MMTHVQCFLYFDNGVSMNTLNVKDTIMVNVILHLVCKAYNFYNCLYNVLLFDWRYFIDQIVIVQCTLILLKECVIYFVVRNIIALH